MPSVSIITPCFNAAPFVGRTIQSALSQTFSDWEMVVVDDGSTDESPSVVCTFVAGEPRIRLVAQPNRGVGAARNRGFSEIAPDSRYLLFLDADDLLRPEMLECLAGYLDAHPDVGMVYCEPTFVDARDQPTLPEKEKRDRKLARKRWESAHGWIRQIPADRPETPFSSFFAWNGVMPSACLIRRAVYEKTSGFDEALGHLFEDTDLFLQIALRSSVHYLPRSLVCYRVHAEQSTSAKAGRLWAQEKKMYDTWLTSRAETAEERRRVLEAWRFRQLVLMPQLRLCWAAERLREGAVVPALRECARGVRHVYSYLPGARAASHYAAQH